MTGARVLVVEDAEAIRVAVQTALAGAGYAVLDKPDGQTLVSAGHQDVWAWDLTAPADERPSGNLPGEEDPK